MAIRYAAANGNWSSVATWDGGVSLPTHGDMVYANGKTVVIDQNIDIGNEVLTTAGAFVVGQVYKIETIGTTNFTLIGATSNTVGVIFLATGVGVGTGTAYTRSGIINAALASPSILTNGGFTLAANYNIRASVIGGGTAGCLTISGNSSTTITGMLGWARSTGIALTITTPGTVNIIGDVYGSPVSNGGATSVTTSSVILNVTGNVYGGAANGARCMLIGSGSGSTMNITGNILPATSSNANVVWYTSAGNFLNITGNVTGGTVSGSEGVLLTSATTAVITGVITGGTAAAGVALASGTLTINGSAVGAAATAIHLSGTGVLNMNGSVTGGTGTGYGITHIGGTLNMTGNVIPTSAVALYLTVGTTTITGNVLPGSTVGIFNTSSLHSLTINGTITGGTTSNAYGVELGVAGSVLVVNGNVTGGSGANAVGILGPASSTSNTITVNGTITASSTANGVRSFSTSTTTDLAINGNLVDHVNGFKAVVAPRWFWTAAPTNRSYVFSVNKLSTYTWYTQDIWNTEYPPQTDVRFGVLYGAGDTFTGSCYVPAANTVTTGVDVDNTVGTAYLSAADILAYLSGATAGVTLGQIESAVRTGLGVATANLDTQLAGIPGGVRTELTTELGRIDAATSTRLASADYDAPIAAATIATAVRSELGVELGRIDIPVSDATTDISGIPLAVRGELTPELALIDVATSTRLASADYDAPIAAATIATAVRSELTTELARIDIPVSDATTDISGIPAAVRLELTPELTLIDAATSTRLAAADYDAPIAAATIATAVRSELGVELTRIDIPVSDATTDISGIPAAVRGELAVELARIDIPVSDATTDISGIPAAVRSELAVELARIDIPVSDATTDITGIPAAVRLELTPELERVANCATVDSTGAQLVALL